MSDREPKVGVLCLPHAGAGPSVYRRWRARLPSWIGLETPEIAGKEKRCGEPPSRSIAAIAEDAIGSIDRGWGSDGKPLVLFGHSMGALVAYEIARRLERANFRAIHLIASACVAPVFDFDRPLLAETDEDLVNGVGLISSNLNTGEWPSEFRDLFMPILRHDLQVRRAYAHKWKEKSNVGVTCLYSRSDRFVSAEDVGRWAEVTDGHVTIVEVGGDHMSLIRDPADAINNIVRAAECLLAGRVRYQAIATNRNQSELSSRPNADADAQTTASAGVGVNDTSRTSSSIALPGGESVPLTEQQWGVIFDQLANPEGTHYNASCYVELPANVDLDRLEAAIGELVRVCSSLRTRFVQVGGEFRQTFVPAAHVELARLGECPDIDMAMQKFVRPFDITSIPLTRFAVAKVNGGLFLLVDIHHLVCDGYSLTLIFENLNALYGGVSLKPESKNYADYARWCQKQAASGSNAAFDAYWMNKVFPLPDPLPLPYDRSRRCVRSGRVGHMSRVLGEPTASGSRDVARQLQITAYEFLLAAYSVALFSITQAQDILIATPTLGRDAPGFQHLVGMFVKTSYARFKPEATQLFRNYVRTVQAEVHAMLRNRPCPIFRLRQLAGINGTGGRKQLFETMFAFHGLRMSSRSFLGHEVARAYKTAGAAMFDIHVHVLERNTVIELQVLYDVDLFEGTTISDFVEIFAATISIASSNPDITLGELAERAAITPPADYNHQRAAGPATPGVTNKDHRA